MNQREIALHKGRRPSPRNAKEARTFARVYRQIPLPRGFTKSRCKQVSRLGFILPGAPSHGSRRNGCRLCCVPRRQLHGYWVSPEISSAFLWRAGSLRRVARLRADTPAIHLSGSIIGGCIQSVNLHFSHSALLRNLNRRDCPPGSSLVSVDLTADEIPATGCRQRFVMDRAIRFFCSSTLTTQTFTTSPTFTTSEGCRMNFSAMRLIWTSPSW